MARERVLNEILTPRTDAGDEIDRWTVAFDPTTVPVMSDEVAQDGANAIVQGG